MNADFLRHGETTAGSCYIGSSDVLLTELGYQQMQASIDNALQLAINDALTGQPTALPWDVVISSPLQRCAIFSASLAEKLGVTHYLEADLREFHFGDWEHKTALQVMAQYPGELENFWSNPQTYSPSGGELLAHFTMRVDSAINGLKTQFTGKKMLVICHGGVMRYLLSKASGNGADKILTYPVKHGELVSLNLELL
ncbi:histidine phosphatase family protein [Gammaproteobacteria bacterium AS21]